MSSERRGPSISPAQKWLCDKCCQARFDTFQQACEHEEKCTAASSSKAPPPGFIQASVEEEKNRRIAEDMVQTIAQYDAVVSAQSTRNQPQTVACLADRRNPCLLPSGSSVVNIIDLSSASTNSEERSKPMHPPKNLAPIFGRSKLHSKRPPKQRSLPRQQHKSKPSARLAPLFTPRHQNVETNSQLRNIAQQHRRSQRGQTIEQHQLPTDKTKTPRKSSVDPRIRFPCPSHVFNQSCDFPDRDNNRLFRVLSQTQLRTARHSLQCSSQNAGRCFLVNEEIEPFDFASTIQRHNQQQQHDDDLIFTTLASFLSPPEHLLHNQLWVDKHSPIQVDRHSSVHASHQNSWWSSSNRAIAEKLVKLVLDWRVQRRKAHNLRAEKQATLLQRQSGFPRKRGPKKKKKKKNLWADVSDDDGEIQNLCLLTGPCGSGKTRMVHAIAQQCDCTVVELNTTVARGRAALRDTLEEATQSDLTKDLFDQHRQTEDVRGRKQLLEDTDEERDGCSVPIILIDEVDVLFEESGDAGFWAELKKLATRAKCPIFLTSIEVPKGVSSITCQHFQLERPKASECVPKLRELFDDEKFTIQSETNVKAGVEAFAQICERDVRKMIHELQLFAYSRNYVADIDNNDDKDVHSSVTKAHKISLSPSIDSIEPVLVPHDVPILLTIRGAGFSVLEKDPKLQVAVGGCPCLVVRVLSDSTLLAVCSPLESDQPSLSRQFARIVIRSQKLGIVCSSLRKEILSDGSRVASFSPWNLEYKLPACTNFSEDSDPEMKVNHSRRNALPYNNTISLKPATGTNLGELQRKAQSMIDGVVNQYGNGLRETKSSADADYDDDCCIVSSNEMEVLARAYCLGSDVALLEGTIELPMLAGAVLGFGSLCVDGSNPANEPIENSKSLSFEKLLLGKRDDEHFFFGTDNAFLSFPLWKRERSLLIKAANCSRGTHQKFGEPSDDMRHNFREDSGVNFGQSTFAEMTEENTFLVPFVDGLVQLKSILQRSLRGRTCRVGSLEQELRNREMRSEGRQCCDTLTALMPKAQRCRIFARAVSRTTQGSVVLWEDIVDDRIFLDYLPIVSNICLHERSADFTFQEGAKSQRPTKRKRVRPHHCEDWNSDLFRGDCIRMGEILARRVLSYRH